MGVAGRTGGKRGREEVGEDRKLARLSLDEQQGVQGDKEKAGSDKKRKASENGGGPKGKIRRVNVRVRSAEYARYGVVEGTIDSERCSAQTTCVVIAKEWPSWAFGAHGAGIGVRSIVLLSNKWCDFITRSFPEASVVSLTQPVDQCGVVGEAEVLQADVVFTDVDPPGVVDLWSIGLETIVSSRRCRRVPKNWKEEVKVLKHNECGGVTTEAYHVHIYHRRDESRWGRFEQSSVAPRDLTGILDTRARQGIPCKAPEAVRFEVPDVVKLSGRNTYHAGGWLPGGTRELHVVVANSFSPTNWCRRKLSAEEWLHVLDLPSGIIKSLQIKEKEDIVGDLSVIPVKVTAAVCEHFSLAQNASGDDGEDISVIQSQGKGAVITGAAEEQSMGVSGASEEEDRTAKATKADDAEVPEYLWDDRLLAKVKVDKSDRVLKALAVLRLALLRVWKKTVTLSYVRWALKGHLLLIAPVRIAGNVMVSCDSHGKYAWTAKGLKQYIAERRKEKKGNMEIRKAAADCIRRSANSSWWEWTEGSTPFFWRWPVWYQDKIREGTPPWLKGEVPKSALPQRPEKDPFMWDAMRKKLEVPIAKGYLEWGMVLSLTSFFAVPKGPTDIRMVYDGTRSGLNEVLYAPWFPLPTVEQLLRSVESGSFMSDIDVGEMFLNFVMHESLRIYCGVDVTNYFPELANIEGATVWLRWGRCGMGFTNSPYVAVQGITVAEEVFMGDRRDRTNVFRWDEVVLNLPGSAGYQPNKPWVCKIRSEDGEIACDVFIYVDDLRPVGPTEEECWLASRRVGSLLNWLGLQDAARKRRPPSQEPGAWAGSIVHTSSDQVEILVSKERWLKAKGMLSWMQEQMLTQEDTLEFKLLESYRGFLIYISRTYPSISPYLKGIHQTLDSWRPWRREDGWRMSEREVRACLAESMEDTEWRMDFTDERKAPVRVSAAPRLKWDLEALVALFEGENPTKRRVRPGKLAVAMYGFGDASGKGFGSSLVIKGVVYFRHGQWSDEVEKESSNFRELSNLVRAVEEAAAKGLLDDCELFLFTDNTTAEGAYYRGTSSSRLLFDLVLRLRILQQRSEVFIHVLHVSGTRMIASGVDALSRGSANEGVMRGEDLLSFVPLHLSAADREGELVNWVLSWANSFEGDFLQLTPSDWFDVGQWRNKCVWCPPPGAADVAVELLAKSKHKRPHHEHLFICPRLMTNRWRKQLSKVCDVIFTIPVGSDVWGLHQHEPLLLGLALPLIKHRPWRLRGVPILERVGRNLSELSPSAPGWGRDILRELLQFMRGLDSMQESLVWEMLHAN